MEHKKFSLNVESGKLSINLDTNQDGEPVFKASVNLSEALQETMMRKSSIAIEGAKIVELKLDVTKLKLKIDTDRDGEALLEFELDLAEAFDEVSGAIAKKKA